MPPNPPSNSRLPQLAVWSDYGTVKTTLFLKSSTFLIHSELLFLVSLRFCWLRSTSRPIKRSELTVLVFKDFNKGCLFRKSY